MSLSLEDEEALFGGYAENPENPAKLSIVQGSYEDPDLYASDNQLATDSGLPLEVVKHDRDEVKRQVGLSKLDLEALSPGLSDWLAKPDNASMSYDDIPLLDEINRASEGSENAFVLEGTKKVVARDWADEELLSESDVEVLEQINQELGKLDASSLRNMTHKLQVFTEFFVPDTATDIPYDAFFLDLKDDGMLEIIREDQEARAPFV